MNNQDNHDDNDYDEDGWGIEGTICKWFFIGLFVWFMVCHYLRS